MTIRKTTEEFISDAVNVHDNFYDYSEVDYKNSRTPIIIICPEHGPFSQRPDKHLLGAGCRSCLSERHSNLFKYKLEDFVAKAKLIHGDRYNYIDYHGYNTKCSIKCPEHGVFEKTPHHHISGQGCPKCAIFKSIINNSSNTDEFVAKAKLIHGDRYNYSNVHYVRNNENVTIVCDKHGEFEQLPSNHLRGCGCPKCNTEISGDQQIVIDYIPEDIDYITNDRESLDGLEIDIYIPNLRFGIEVHGCYWHGLKANNHDSHHRLRNLHRDKASQARNKHIKLYQFWDFEVRSSIVKSMVLNALGRSKMIYARKCEVKSVDNDLAKHFFDNTHLQGHRCASVYFGLFLDEEMVACLSLSRHNVYDWEIIRFANKLNCSVVGGFSRLFKRFVREYQPSQVLTFADARFSVGNVYSNNGFRLIEYTQPNYFYSKRMIRLSRQKCQKSKLPRLLGQSFDPELSETDNMIKAGFCKIYDAGHCKLLWDQK